MSIRMLLEDDAAAFQEVRLQGLLECPSAFTSSYEEERERPLSVVAERLAPTPGHAVFGAFSASRLAGVVGLHREEPRKLAHKAFIWGMYVVPEYRKRGLGRRLVETALEHAESMTGLRQVSLGVNARNDAAIRLYEAVGFERFGVERGFLLVDGELHDEVMMVVRLPRRPLEG